LGRHVAVFEDVNRKFTKVMAKTTPATTVQEFCRLDGM